MRRGFYDQSRLAQNPELAAARQKALAEGPDKGWDYSVCHDGAEEGVRRAIHDRHRACTVPRFAVRFAAKDAPWWCRHEALRQALEDCRRALDNWQDLEALAKIAVGKTAWRKHREAAADPAAVYGLELAHGVVLRAYTDRDLDAWPLMNKLARALPHFDPLPLADEHLYRTGLLIYLMDEALKRLPPIEGSFRRGVKPEGLGERRTDFMKAHTRRGRIVSWEGYTSVMDGKPYEGRVKFIVHTRSARDLRTFSLKGEQELILPRAVRLRIVDYRFADDEYVIEVEETSDDRPIRRDYRFHVE